jgi:hypothetical protein
VVVELVQQQTLVDKLVLVVQAVVVQVRLLLLRELLELLTQAVVEVVVLELVVQAQRLVVLVVQV